VFLFTVFDLLKTTKESFTHYSLESRLPKSRGEPCY